MVSVLIDSTGYESEAKLLKKGNFVKVDHFGPKRAQTPTEDVAGTEKVTWSYTTDEVLYVNTNTEVSLY